MPIVVSSPPIAILLKGVVIVKVAHVEPFGTTTCSGTDAESGGSAARDTSISSYAGWFRVTLPCTGLPPTTLLMFTVTEASSILSSARAVSARAPMAKSSMIQKVLSVSIIFILLRKCINSLHAAPAANTQTTDQPKQ